MADLKREVLAPVTGYDTKYMMERMCIGSNRLESVAEKDESFLASDNFKKMVIMEHYGADNYNKSREEPEGLKQVTRIVEGNLATLSTTKDPAAIANKNNLTAVYAEHSNHISGLEKERTQLVTDAKEYRTEQSQTFSKLGQEISKNPDADITADLNKLKEEQKHLTKRIKDLVKNENDMVVKLQPLVTQTTVTVRTLGLPVTEVITPIRQIGG